MLGSNLPNVPVTDLDIHIEEGILLAATYGRSLYTYNIGVGIGIRPSYDIDDNQMDKRENKE